MKKVYFARAMDGLSRSEILLHYEQVNRALTEAGLRLVNLPRSEDSFFDGESDLGPDQEVRKIVEQGLRKLRQADVLIADLSIPGHNYIGCICEIVYAHLWQKKVVVFTGDSGNETRPWLRYHTTHLCSTFDEAINHVMRIFKRT